MVVASTEYLPKGQPTSGSIVAEPATRGLWHHMPTQERHEGGGQRREQRIVFPEDVRAFYVPTERLQRLVQELG